MLGYVWSLAKPLMYFTVLWVVFGTSSSAAINRYPLYLLIGIVLYTFLVDAVTATLPSIVSSGPTLRRISFPPLVIPLATIARRGDDVRSPTASSWRSSSPSAGWRREPSGCLLVPLVLELYVFVARRSR